MKRILLSAGAGLALALTPIAAAAQGEEPSSEELVAMGNMFAEMFTTEPLTEEQQARVPAAQAIIDLMMPEGFYAEMMGETMTSASICAAMSKPTPTGTWSSSKAPFPDRNQAGSPSRTP